MRTTFTNINYLVDNFSENDIVSKSKLERDIFELHNFVC